MTGLASIPEGDGDPSFDLFRSGEQRRRDFQAKRFGGFEIDQKLEFRYRAPRRDILSLSAASCRGRGTALR